MPMKRGAVIWEELIVEAIRVGTHYSLSKTAAHGFSMALKRLMLVHILETGELIIPYFGKFEVRLHKGGVRTTPPVAGSKRVIVKPYNRLHFKANKKVRREIEKCASK